MAKEGQKKFFSYNNDILPLRRVLAKLYPQCFTDPDDKKVLKHPIKIGIHHDLIALHPDINVNLLRVTLKDYCSGPKYHEAMISNRCRVDLNGVNVGFPSEKDIIHQKKWFQEQQETWKKQAERRVRQFPRKGQQNGDRNTASEQRAPTM